jgi:hypothetical protein
VFFENGAAAFQPKARPNHSAEQSDMPDMGMNALQQRRIRRQSAAIKSYGAILQSVPLGG